MAGCTSCCGETTRVENARWRRVLAVALGINVMMFAIEIAAGVAADSAALKADALDFLGDSANYAISLGVAGLVLTWRARAALVKGATIFAFGLWVLGSAIWSISHGGLPHPEAMGAVGLLALIANGGVALLLYRYRGGDANMRSVWICSRNDALGNVAVMLAALGVFGTGSAWPDLLVAATMAMLALWGGAQILYQAWRELHAPTPLAIAAE